MSTRRDFLLQAAAAGGLTATVTDPVRTVAAPDQDHGASGRPVKTSKLTTYKIPQTDLVVSRIAYGTAVLLEWTRQPLSSEVIAQAVHVINAAYDNGITFFDTANVYALGHAERVLGQALSQSPGLRDRVVIQSKCGIVLENLQGQGPFHLNYASDYVVSSVEDSLRRLGTDHLDILLMHWPDPLMRPEEVARAFDKLSDSGKVRYFGVSNFTASQIELLRKWVRVPIVVNQIHLSLADSYLMAGGLAGLWSFDFNQHDYSTGTLDYCRLHDIQVQAYSPLRSDLLNPPENAAPELKSAAHTLREIAARKGSTPTAISLAWLLHHPARIVPVIGSLNPTHIADNCTADAVTLSYDDWYSLLIATVNLPRKPPVAS